MRADALINNIFGEKAGTGPGKTNKSGTGS